MTEKEEIALGTRIRFAPLIVLTLAFAVFAPHAFGQKKQAPAKAKPWQEVKLERWGVSFSIPSDFKDATIVDEEEEPDTDDGNYTESRTYKRATKAKTQQIELSISLRNSKGETIKTEYSGKEVTMTAEQLLALDYIGDTNTVKRADSTGLEAEYLEISGVVGVMSVANMTPAAGKSVKPSNETLGAWGTWRLFRGNIQQILFSVTGRRTNLETMKKIINSLKIDQ